MRNFFCLLFMFIHPFVYSNTGVIDVQHYKFELQLSDQSDSIKGKATITIKFLQNLSEFSLDLANSNSQRKGMQLYSVMDNNNAVAANHQNNKLTIPLSPAAKPGETRTFTILYGGIPADGLIISTTKYGNRSFFADNWPNRGHNWLPSNDHPADKATVEFIVTAPQHYQVVANGIQVEETNLPDKTKRTHWKEDVPLATKIMVIGVAEFAVNLAGTINNCIPVYSYVYPADRDKGFYDYALAAEILPWYIKTVGPYGYKKLANVQSKTTFGGLENANTIFYAENSVTGTRKSESLLSHEIAHQWFGDMATETSFAHLWLSEGFASYFTVLYFEQKYGKDTATQMLLKDRATVTAYAKKSSAPVVNEAITDYMKMLNANSYQKASWVLHMLRKKLGDDNFLKGVREYYATYAGSNASTKDFQKIMEKTSGQDLEQFFKQWLYTAGQPVLQAKWKYDAVKKEVKVTIMQQQSELFHFPLTVGIIVENSQSSRTETIKQKETSVVIKTDKRPTRVVLDPSTELLFEATIMEDKQ